jgi:hypothetical protein
MKSIEVFPTRMIVPKEDVVEKRIENSYDDVLMGEERARLNTPLPEKTSVRTAARKSIKD